MKLSGLSLKKFFNTNGKLFKEKNLKELWDTMDESQLLEILASDGMIHKRPVLIGDDFVMIGFKIAEWEENVLKRKLEQLR